MTNNIHKNNLNTLINFNNTNNCIIIKTENTQIELQNKSFFYSFLNSNTIYFSEEDILFIISILKQSFFHFISLIYIKSNITSNNINDTFNLSKLIFSINFYQSCVIFNINQNKTIQNKTITNDKQDHEIKDATFQYFLKDKKKFLENIKIIKNLSRIYIKYKTNKYLKEIFN